MAADRTPRLGAHMSVAGGLSRAVDRALIHGCEAFQIFTKNANRWHGSPLSPFEVGMFRARVSASGLHPVVSHASYLINLAASDPTLRSRSIAALADELDRAEALGLLGVVLHPGCHTDDTEAAGLSRVAESLSGLLHDREGGRTLVLLEHTAGQGTSLGATFEQLAIIISETGGHRRLGVCLDTCHLFASGYDIASADGYDATFSHFDRLIGFERLKVLHLNDSKKPLGSRVDRHAHIGEGHLGLEPFRRLVNDPRLTDLPMLLETPKDAPPSSGSVTVDRFDEQNLRRLRGLLADVPVNRPRETLPQ